MAYAAVWVAYAWPLPLYFATHLTGDPAGDTGVYLWNLWVFHREVLERHGLPYFTNAIFSMTSEPANLSLHNYTVFQDLVALPFIDSLGLVTAFNLAQFVSRILTAWLMFLLARSVSGRTPESWLAGLAFAWSPVLITRSMGHFSLVAAAPLAAFLLALLAGSARGRWYWRDALWLGLSLSWATMTDVYYGVFCLMIGALFLLMRAFTVAPAPATLPRALRALDVAIVLLAILVGAIAASGGWRFSLAGVSIGLRGLYTPVFLLSGAIALRLLWPYRLQWACSRSELWRTARMVGGVGAISAVLLSPLLYAFAVRVLAGRFDGSTTYWRSSPGGVDLLALVLPNPNHPLAPVSWRAWLTPSTPDSYFEQVASLPVIALLTLGFAAVVGWRAPRWWLTLTVTFGALALGPFIHAAGANTHVPGPWALLRYVPVFEFVRTPARFSILLMLGVGVLFASALGWVTTRWPRYRMVTLTAVAGLLLFELLPAPRQLHAARIPTIYRYVNTASPDARILHLPFGVRDGTTSEGNFSPETQYFQTAHGRRIIGGYLSRVSTRRRRELRTEPVLDALVRMSEDRPLLTSQRDDFLRDARQFCRRAGIAFVVMDRRRMPPLLDSTVRNAMQLQFVAADGPFELYTPGLPPADDPVSDLALR